MKQILPQKPIVCKCGRAHIPIDWVMLDYIGTQPDGDGGLLELRNCLCGSTISIPWSPTKGYITIN